jgi:hypothetical protein
MNVCEAYFDRDPVSTPYRKCATCGHPYWVHSHEYYLPKGVSAPFPGPRAQHRIITADQASAKWWSHSINGDPDGDLRPRYQIMQERQVSISKFYLTAAQLHKHRVDDGKHRLAALRRSVQAAIEDEVRAFHAPDLDRSFMVVCRTCGNKRCPRATNSELPCTHSNEPGQPGSRYQPAVLTVQDWDF